MPIAGPCDRPSHNPFVPCPKRVPTVTSRSTFIAVALAGLVALSRTQGAESPATSVAAIQAKHDRAFIRDLTEYLARYPKADDRDQAYAALFNKAIEHDWFA